MRLWWYPRSIRHNRLAPSGPGGPLMVGVLAAALMACSPVDFTHPGSLEPPVPADSTAYFAEFCAVSQIRQKRGMGAEIRGEPGGHAVFSLHGACRARVRGQTRLVPCDSPDAEPADGAGISMNAHFRNAKWVATPGRDFFLNGGLAQHEALTPQRFAAVQTEAKRRRIYDGIAFHDWVFDDRPDRITREDWQYEVSVATDYAIALGRGRFCARVPVNRSQLIAMVDFLNAENAPYRDGGADFHWSLFQDNCIHLAHNALAAAGFWAEWPTHRPWIVSMFDFPVPRNEFINMMRRSADTRLLDPGRLHADEAARRALLQFGQLPIRPGALAESRAVQQPNAIYHTDLALWFYDDPVLGGYRRWSDAILGDPTQHDRHANQAWVAALYRQALNARKPLTWWQAQPDLTERDAFAVTYSAFYATLEAETARLVSRERVE